MQDGNPQHTGAGNSRAARDGVSRGKPEDCLQRRCAVSRAVHHKDKLIRFVAGPEDQIVPDLTGKLPGRGVWVECLRKSVDEAVKRGAFQRSLRKKVNVPADLGAEVDRLMASRAKNALSLAKKAGLVAVGFTKTGQAITQCQLAALVQASDGAEDGIRKLERLYAAVAAEAGEEPVCLKILTIDEMSLAFGRSNVVHAAIRSGGAATSFVAAALRLEQYRSGKTLEMPHSDEAGGPGERRAGEA